MTFSPGRVTLYNTQTVYGKGLENLIVCTGTKDFGPIYPGNEDLGGFYFSYPRRFAKNRSNPARSLALKTARGVSNGTTRVRDAAVINRAVGDGRHPFTGRLGVRPVGAHRLRGTSAVDDRGLQVAGSARKGLREASMRTSAEMKSAPASGGMRQATGATSARRTRKRTRNPSTKGTRGAS